MQELGLYDIHCHIVPGVDDGAVNLEEAVKMVEAQYKQGIRTIIATPHFRKGMFEPSASEVKKQRTYGCLHRKADKGGGR